MPPWLAAQMRPGIDSLVEEIVAAIETGVPEYSRPFDDLYMTMLRRGVSQAVGKFVERVASQTTPSGDTAELFRDIGRLEAAEGRTLEPLQAALRIGARVAWNRLYKTATLTGIDLVSFARIGEAIFLYLDEIMAASAAGFAQAKAEVAGEIERRRRRLLDLLIAGPPASPEAIADLSRAVGWRLPGTVAVVVLEDRQPAEFPPLPSMPPEVLIDMSRRDPCLLVPDADGPGRAGLLRQGLRGWRAAIGPTVPPRLASSSLRWASQALALAQRGVLSWDGDTIWCATCMPQLILHADEDLLGIFAARMLKPMAGLHPAQRERFAQTLLAWLQEWGNAAAAARRLHVHPQTVRYRLRQISELFGDDLRDPGKRFALEIALQVGPPERLAGTPRRKPRGLPRGL